MDLQNAKGTRDFLPEEKITRQWLVDELRKVFELYGYNPLETPAIELYEILAAKYAGGAAILEETFKLKDRGGRDLALRYDLTVPFSRVIGMNPQLKMPFKRYQMAKVWRDGPVGLARYREFWQCDVDVVGIKSVMAEAELLSMVETVFDRLGLDIEINVNHIKVLHAVLDYAGIESSKEDVILIVDKLKKIGEEGVKSELKSLGLNEKVIEKLMSVLNMKGSNKEIVEKLNNIIETDEGKQGVKELNELMLYLEKFNVTKVKLDVSLARGLLFYTGPVFETFLVNNEVKSSVAGGGRYDKIIGNFLGTGKEYPATGISFGLDRIYDALKSINKFKPKKSVTKVLVVPIVEQDKAIEVCTKLRKQGIKTEVDMMQRSITKNLDYANSLNIPYVVFVGPKEVQLGKVKLKDMNTGEEFLLNFDEISKKIK